MKTKVSESEHPAAGKVSVEDLRTLVEQSHKKCSVYDEEDLSKMVSEYEKEVNVQKKKLREWCSKHSTSSQKLEKNSKSMQRERQKLMQKYNTLEHDHTVLKMKEKQSNQKNKYSDLSLKKSTASAELLEARKKLESNEQKQNKELQEHIENMKKWERKASKQARMVADILVEKLVAEKWLQQIQSQQNGTPTESNGCESFINEVIETIKQPYISYTHPPENTGAGNINKAKGSNRSKGLIRKPHKLSTVTVN